VIKPLKVAVIHSYHREQTSERMHGAWSYPVPEFTWTREKVRDGYVIDRADYKDYDFVLIEDAHALGTITGKGTPVVYWVGDSIMSEWHYKIRYTQAEGADLILLTQDDIGRFAGTGKPVRHWMMCIDEHLFNNHYGEKSTDVGFFYAATTERLYYAWQLSAFCDRKGYKFQQGWRDGKDYAKSFARCRINVNVAYNRANWSYRMFHVMASGSCLLTTPAPELDPEAIKCYTVFNSVAELTELIDVYLTSGAWEEMAQMGYDLAQRKHTWSRRAAELRQIVNEEFGL